jgi:hypothetical protein
LIKEFLSDEFMSQQSARKGYDIPASTPSAGGTHRAGKDPANCDDALGHPGKHRGSHKQAEVKSGKGPAATKKQVGEITAKYPDSSAGYN